MVFSEEAVKEVDARLNNPDNYLTVDGGMHQSAGNDITDWIFRNFTGI